MKKERKLLRAIDLQLNTGQLPWLPKNPRQWTSEDMERMRKSIREDEDFLDDRPALVVPHEKRYIVFAGNFRTDAARLEGVNDIPAIIYTPENEDDQMTVIRRAMKDNGSYGAWDWDILANEWSDFALGDWGVPEWKTPEDDVENYTGNAGEGGERPEKDEAVEALLDDAMKENVKESFDQINYMMERGWLSSFLTKGLAQAKFLRAKYYKEHYPQWVSLYFCPERFFTSANKKSCYQQLELIAKGETEAGIAGLRTLSGDHLLLLLLKGSYPFGSARMPMDFPANTAEGLIQEFAGAGATVLDPCHGWGGRLTGALLADASLYVGVDPSDEAHRGVERIAEAFLPYCSNSRAEFILSPFEDADLGGRTFDFALTSPPYFDVEQYHGEGQAHIRYPKYDKWVAGFYRPLIEKTYAALKPGGVFAINVGSQSYPLVQDAQTIAKSVGFKVSEIRPLGGGTSSALHNNTDEDEENEKIIILKK